MFTFLDASIVIFSNFQYRMIDDIIEFVDNEDDEGVIIFVDQQKTFDRMEWGWLNYVMECFNFGLKFREWVYMLTPVTYVISIPPFME
jgi:superfamily I DNA and/or RNA helicase